MADILLAHAYFLKHDVIEQRVMKPYPPLGILCLSAYLKRAGFSVEVFDATFRDPQDFQEAVRRIRPRIVGIYANIITRDNVFRMARIARDNGVKYIVCGGPDAPEWADLYFQNGVDIIGTNEGERTLEALIPWLDERGMSGLESVPGIIYRRDGKAWRTPPRDAITNLDTLPWPDRDVVVMEDYFKAWQTRHGERSVSLITARGCPFHCAWCSSEVFGHSHRQRSPGNVVDEMVMLRQKYNPDILWISDDVLTINRKWSLEFFQEVQRRGAVHPFECLSRVDLVDTEILTGLKQAGCF
jgi:anaerobic magnesium-protoporphyrin IX monomethyl ester cyclase